MIRRRRARTDTSTPSWAAGQRGYALLMVVFLAALVVIATAAAVPSILIQGRRQQEDEMIWRGEQYQRGVRLYFKKKGHFPQSFEDLTKPQADIRFMRQAYKDPMNGEDGSWRLVYVTPAGQLIGSLHYTSLAQMDATEHHRPGAPPGAVPQTVPPEPAPPGTMLRKPDEEEQEEDEQTETDQGAAGQKGQPPNQLGATPTSEGQPQELEASEGPVIGGSIIGVGSKVKKPSLKVYKGGKTYRDWEFIWDPLAEAKITIKGGAGQSTPSGQGSNPLQNPSQVPPSPPQNPPRPPSEP